MSVGAAVGEGCGPVGGGHAVGVVVWRNSSNHLADAQDKITTSSRTNKASSVPTETLVRGRVRAERNTGVQTCPRASGSRWDGQPRAKSHFFPRLRRPPCPDSAKSLFIVSLIRLARDSRVFFKDLRVWGLKTQKIFLPAGGRNLGETAVPRASGVGETRVSRVPGVSQTLY